ncbi:MAG TPA: 16S rRNA (cytidine(1402)-2'-O)-methyltransferase [Candidatus Baltobacteraceae bacterium]|jgi:16S rRNA (cytidine1402-2'-O)-methyltransferase|nr:16S rRNA (cytidine(1402)-2'-O)-methyltransferase [Candidatus Baltobacteraceae bacterium]
MPLVLVPTPLGNLRDITVRALDVLRDCDLLVAEDSRVARKLLTALNLPGKEIWSYHEHNAQAVTPGILQQAQTRLVALVADAGTPGISDPGSALVAAAREQQIAVEVLPGPSAAIGAAVLSGFPLRRFVFEGFAPRTGGARREALARSFALGIPSVWYESPARVTALLADIERVDPRARVFLLREYTKRYEQHLAGTAAEVAQRLEQPVRGEIALAILPSERAESEAQTSPGELDAEIDALLAAGSSVSAIAKTLGERGLGARRHIYARAADRKRMRRDGHAGQR